MNSWELQRRMDEYQQNGGQSTSKPSTSRRAQPIRVTAAQAYGALWGGYFRFQGRATRAEYWKAWLVNALVILLISSATALIGHGAAVIFDLYAVAIVLPFVSLMVRRLHDINKSGWWWWISVIPILGAVILLIFSALAGDDGNNRFGEPSRIGVL